MTWTLLQGHCLEVMQEMEANSVDAVVTDPPYELGFMGKSWDASGIAYNVEMWQEVCRMLKPGGYLLSFGGSRTYHRMACAIEDAGFEIRDQIMWIYGRGFPKSLDIGKAIDKAAGAERDVVGRSQHSANRKVDIGYMGTGHNEPERLLTTPATPEAKQWDGWGTALKPAHEPVVMARKPLAEKTVAGNVLEWGTGGINIDGCRVEYNGELPNMGGRKNAKMGGDQPYGFKIEGRPDKPNMQGRFPANLILSYPEDEYMLCEDAKPEQLIELGEWLNENT